MKVEVLKSGDNYIYLVICGDQAAVIDPSNARPVLNEARNAGTKITHVLVTHHHFDHTGGCSELKRACSCAIVGPEGSGIPSLTRTVTEGSTISIGGYEFEVMAVPGHTRDHVAYYCSSQGIIFTGDVMFVAGCGRIFEGTAEQMWQSLHRIASLPDETMIFCGHEYTMENLEFALHLDPRNEHIQRRIEDIGARLAGGQPSVPSTVGAEKLTNPFLRARDAADFASIRKRKNVW